MRLIDADALLDHVIDIHCKNCERRKGVKNGKYRIIYEVGDVPCRSCGVDDMKSYLENAPTIEPERKKGKWIPHPGGKFIGFPYMHYECDQCRDFEPEERNFCPNCGCQMER